MVPEKITIRGNRKKMEGNIGSDAAEGLIAFSLAMENSTETYSASYDVVVDVNGTIVRMSPTFQHLGWGKHTAGMKFHPTDPDRMLLAVDDMGTEYGPWVSWNYTTEWNSYTYVVEKDFLNDCHDIQMSKDSTDVYWGVSRVDMNAFASSDYSGDIMEIHYPLGESEDLEFNHVQLIDNDEVAILSDKETNMFMKYNLSSREIIFTAGGGHGTLALVDETGERHEAGDSLWFGQHNVEYFGDDLVLM